MLSQLLRSLIRMRLRVSDDWRRFVLRARYLPAMSHHVQKAVEPQEGCEAGVKARGPALQCTRKNAGEGQEPVKPQQGCTKGLSRSLRRKVKAPGWLLKA